MGWGVRSRGARGKRTIRWALAALAAPTVAWTAAPASAAIVGPAPIRATRAEEDFPASSGGYLAWGQVVRGSQVWVRAPHSGIVRANAPRTFGWPGGFDGKRLAFQQSKQGRMNSDIFLFNVKTRRTRGFPAKVNTRQWEYGPTMSGDDVLFGRNRGGRDWRIMLFDRRTARLRTLSGPTNASELVVGQINGRFAVWTRARSVGWDVIRSDLTTGTATRIPRPDGVFAQYAPSVTSDGTVYFASSGNACGRNVSIERRPIGGPTTTLFAVGGRRDIQRTYVDESGAHTRVLYDPGTCLFSQGPDRFLWNQDVWGFTDLGGAGAGPPAVAAPPEHGGPGKPMVFPQAGVFGEDRPTGSH